jgi:hypothetical protein
MSDDLQPAESQAQTPQKPLWRKWLIRCLWIAPVVYLLLFTSFWAFWYSTIVGPLTGAKDLREFGASAWCKPGDFVLNILQPMVSDARMIEHFEKNKVEMEQMAKMAMYGDVLNDTDDMPQAFKKADTKHVAALKKIKIKNVVSSGFWYANPY